MAKLCWCRGDSQPWKPVVGCCTNTLRGSLVSAASSGGAEDGEEEKHSTFIRVLRLCVPVCSAGTARVLLSIPGVGSKAFSAGPAGDGSALGERERENLWGSEAPKAFLHAQVGCGHRGQSQQVPAGKSVPAASANPRYPKPWRCHGMFEMYWGYTWPGRLWGDLQGNLNHQV